MDPFPMAHLIKKIRYIWGVFCIFLMGSEVSVASLLEGIHLSESPPLISLRFDADVRWRVYQTGPRELLIALQDTSVARDLARSGSGAPVIQRIVYKRTADGNATLLVETGVDVRAVDASWRAGVGLLEIRLDTDQRLAHKQPRGKLEKRRREVHVAAVPQESPPMRIPEPVKTVTPPPLQNITVASISDPPSSHGGIDTLLDAVLASPCAEGMHVRIAVRSIREEGCDRGMDILAEGLAPGCEELYDYLENWCRMSGAVTPELQLGLIRDLSGLVVKNADSAFVPWGYAMLGILYHKMGNDPVGMGYFDLLREASPKFPGMAEVLLYLARMHMRLQHMDEAEPLLRDIVARFSTTVYAREARMELGRVLFARKRYFETIKMLDAVVGEEPDAVLREPDLLLLLGNSHFHTGGYSQAIENLMRVYNDFTDIAEPSLILTRIAESYAALPEPEKARKLYELVRELYPGTDGFVVSSMRLAELLEKREDRDALFQMVIQDYPDHSLARLALMRLAESRYQAEDYEETVRLIRQLLSEDPRALRRDALILMGRALEALFEGYLADNLYPDLIDRYDVEKGPVYEMENPRLHALVGRAFFRGHLYPQALPEYQRAEMLWGGAPLPPDFLFEYGVVSTETGGRDKGLSLLSDFLKAAPTDFQRSAEAWGYIARIHFEEGRQEAGLKAYAKAADLAPEGRRKVFFWQTLSRLYRDRKEPVKEMAVLEQALAFLGKAGQDSDDLRFVLLRSLGEAQVGEKRFAAALSSYEKTDGLTGIPTPDRNAVRFRRGEVLEKLGRQAEAKALYRSLVEEGDPLWGALAGERLEGLRIKEQLLQ